MRSIGEMARHSGLGVRALWFYDHAGVLVPAPQIGVHGKREPRSVVDGLIQAMICP